MSIPQATSEIQRLLVMKCLRVSLMPYCIMAYNGGSATWGRRAFDMYLYQVDVGYTPLGNAEGFAQPG
jgi:hypothetical protein